MKTSMEPTLPTLLQFFKNILLPKIYRLVQGYQAHDTHPISQYDDIFKK